MWLYLSWYEDMGKCSVLLGRGRTIFPMATRSALCRIRGLLPHLQERIYSIYDALQTISVPSASEFLPVSSAFQKKEEMNPFLLQLWHFSPLHSLREKQCFNTFTKVWEGSLVATEKVVLLMFNCEELPLKWAARSFHYILIKDLKYHSIVFIACQHDQTHAIIFRSICTRCSLTLEHRNRSVITSHTT